MNSINNYFNSRDLFFNKISLCDSEQTKNILKNVTGEKGSAPIVKALLNLGSALCSYNSSVRSYTQKIVAIENSVSGFYKKTHLKYTGLEKREIAGLIFTIFWLSGYQQLGEALTVTADLLQTLPAYIPETLPDLTKALNIFYDLTYLGLYLSPQGHSVIILLKISKVAYFVFNEYLECSLSWDEIQTTIKKTTPADAINLLARGIHLYGNSLQLYTAGNALLK